MVGLGIGQHCPGEVGFFKPLGTNVVNGIDEDVMLFKQVFQLEEAPEKFNLSHDYRRILHDTKGTTFEPALQERYTQLSRGKDFMILESAHTMSYGSYTGLSAPEVAAALKCPALVIAEGAPEKIVDKSIMAQRCFEVKNAALLGVVINRTQGVDEEFVSQLQERGIDLLGVIPEYEELAVPTCEDIIDSLDGELVAGEEGLCKKVKTTLVGAMTFDSAQRALQQIEYPENTVMVTGGDRADMQLLAFDMKSSLLVLTGNAYPSAAVLSKADELQIPVVMVPYDTMTAASRCEEATARLRPSHAAVVKEIVGTHVDVAQIVEAAHR
jgi:hypothetical protein